MCRGGCFRRCAIAFVTVESGCTMRCTLLRKCCHTEKYAEAANSIERNKARVRSCVSPLRSRSTYLFKPSLHDFFRLEVDPTLGYMRSDSTCAPSVPPCSFPAHTLLVALFSMPNHSIAEGHRHNVRRAPRQLAEGIFRRMVKSKQRPREALEAL